jgi:predicted nucleic-acid-binding protein
VIAIDTNVVVRLIADDDQAQVSSALHLMDRHDVFVSFGVLMESEWVLRSQYGMSRNEVNTALSAFIQLGPVNLSDRQGVRWALERHADGADLTDMLHLVDSGAAAQFASFDRNLAKQSGPNPPLPILAL